MQTAQNNFGAAPTAGLCQFESRTPTWIGNAGGGGLVLQSTDDLTISINPEFDEHRIYFGAIVAYVLFDAPAISNGNITGAVDFFLGGRLVGSIPFLQGGTIFTAAGAINYGTFSVNPRGMFFSYGGNNSAVGLNTAYLPFLEGITILTPSTESISLAYNTFTGGPFVGARYQPPFTAVQGVVGFELVYGTTVEPMINTAFPMKGNFDSAHIRLTGATPGVNGIKLFLSIFSKKQTPGVYNAYQNEYDDENISE
jgi:hypothetical protein